MNKKIKLSKVDPLKVKKLNEGVDDVSGNKYIVMAVIFVISIIIILANGL